MDSNPCHDAELVSQTLAGNRAAFGQLYDQYAQMVRAVVAGVSGDWPAVEDMTQETFLRAYRNLARLRDPERLAPWFAGIARQVARERRRTLRRDRHEFSHQHPDVESPGDANADLHDRDQLDRLIQIVAELPERERLVIHAYYLEQQNAQQAAGIVGLSRSGFYALLQRALARLATQLRPSATKARTR